MITFQQLIRRLNDFWEKQGCAIHFGHDIEVGAGTLNPVTFLRCLGPDPYRAAYVEPSRRPADARFGQNPNRLHLFHQYQVIIKPSPSNIQALYLRSLKAIGLKLENHDIRFVHDDWEQPTLGAWGLGWEVWCDGMEISQFTYFQGMASLPLNPITAEITIGLERLCMYLQNVDNIFDIKWNHDLTLGQIAKQSEVEWSTYNFNVATPAHWLKHFDDYEKEAQNALAKNLPIPAHDFVLKASHAFNILDARSVISTTDRPFYIARVRDLARSVAEHYIKKNAFAEPAFEKPRLKIKKASSKFDPDRRADFLLEIGSDQLPSTYIPIGLRNLEKSLRALLDDHKLPYDGIKTYGTPRRLAILVQNLPEGSPAQVIEKRGPALSAAFVGDKLTPQGEGFLNGLKIPKTTLSALSKSKHLQIRSFKETDYLFATVTQKGRSTAQILAEKLPSLIEHLEFPKKMRWGTLDVTYPRPIHWILAIHGETIIPFTFGDVRSGRDTFGHAQLSNVKITIPSPALYLSSLKDHFVMADISDRSDMIKNQLVGKNAAEETRVIPQVVNLTEWPQLTIATFDKEFLKAPPELLISEMVEHQKYFPVREGANLSNQFIITADNTPTDLIRSGNQKVLSARLFDGLYLYNQDLKTDLDTFNEKLKTVTFQKELGSLYDKMERVREMAKKLNALLELADPHKADRAATLSKADLVSLCVKEFPELQGVMGKYLALAKNEDPLVALAIEEQWMPKSEGAALPSSDLGTLLSLADKLDNLISFFRVGLKPTSSSDPYSLRRQTIGIIRMLIDRKIPLDLQQIIRDEEVLKFITARAKGVFEDFGFKKDSVEASLHTLCTNPYEQFCKVEALNSFRETLAFKNLIEVFKRAKGQLDVKITTSFNPSLATEPAEQELIRALHHLEEKWASTLAEKNYAKAYEMMAHLQQPLANLFDHVKILADDPTLRANRLALLQKIFSLFSTLIDLGKIQS